MHTSTVSVAHSIYCLDKIDSMRICWFYGARISMEAPREDKEREKGAVELVAKDTSARGKERERGEINFH